MTQRPEALNPPPIKAPRRDTQAEWRFLAPRIGQNINILLLSGKSIKLQLTAFDNYNLLCRDAGGNEVLICKHAIAMLSGGGKDE